MDYLQVPRFSMSDLMRPTAQRTRIILSAVINFMRFHEEQAPLFDQLSEHSQNLAKRRMDIAAKHMALAEELNSIKLYREEQEPEVALLRDENRSLAAELKELKAKGDLLNHEMTKLKQGKADVLDLIKNDRLALDQVKQECTRLRGRIVRNPEQLKTTIVEMSENLAMLKRSVSDMERHARELQVKSENLNVVDQDLMLGLTHLNDCEEAFRRMESSEQKLNAETDHMDRQKAELRSLALKEQQLARKVQSAEEKLRRFEKQTTLKREQQDTALNKIRTDYESVGLERSHLQDQLDRYEGDMAETKQKIHKLKQQHEQETHEIQSELEKLKEHVLTYVNDMRLTMQAVPMAMNIV